MLLEGVEYQIKWRALARGESFFIPCLNYATAKKIIGSEARLRGLRVLAKGVIENKLKGLRVWRL